MFKVDDNKAIFKAIHRSQHTQRNYDLSKTMPQEDLDLLVEAATQCPSKQNIAHYRAHFITDRDIIEKIHSCTDGFTLNNKDPNVENNTVTNSQVLGNLLIVFESYRDYRLKFAMRNQHNYISETGAYNVDFEKPNDWYIERDRHMAIGIAAGYVNITAAMMGYGTGCCACFEPKDVKEILSLRGEPLLMMGVGFKQEGVNRRIHHKTGFKFPTLVKQKIKTKFWN